MFPVLFQNLPVLRVLAKYSAVCMDEISITRGDMVQLLGVDHMNNRFLVYKASNGVHPAVEGWIPGFSLGKLTN